MDSIFYSFFLREEHMQRAVLAVLKEFIPNIEQV